MFEIVIRVLFLLVGIGGGFLLAYFARRPRLKLEGHGSGSHSVEGRGLMITDANIYNDPSFFGLKLNREPAEIISALIFDPELKTYVGPSLVWQKGGSGAGGKDLEPEHTISSGMAGRLFLFVKNPFDESFSVYHSATLDTEPASSWPKYKDLQKVFTLMLVDKNRRKYRFKLDARNGEQSVSLFFKKTLRDRWDTLLEVFR